jgi:hypothetical protein
VHTGSHSSRHAFLVAGATGLLVEIGTISTLTAVCETMLD